MAHTPEPWHVFNYSWSDTSVLADGFDHAICCLDINHATEESQEADAAIMEANARRIVACVNACQGIPTEPLEVGGLGALLSLGLEEQERGDVAEKQRDELLVALEEIKQWTGKYCAANHPIITFADKAIASVKGGA